MPSPRSLLAAAGPPRRTGARAAALLLLLLAAPAAAPAQQPSRAQPPALAALRLGAASPTGALGDLSGDGVLVGLALGYRALPRVELRGQLDVARLARGGRPSRPGGAAGPRTRLLHYLGGLQVELTDPYLSKWEIAVSALGGGTWLDLEDGPPGVPDRSEQRPTLHGAWQFGYDVLKQVTLYARAGGYVLVGAPPAGGAGRGDELLWSQSAGVRIRF